MKAAGAVLAASLLFFLGVLTGAGRREAVPPPTAIPLGVVRAGGAAPAGGPAPASPSSPAPRGPARTTATTAPIPSTTTTVPMAGTVTTAPSDARGTVTTGPATTSTSAGPGQVEQVDNQVDCTPAGRRGKGHRSPCPSTTATTSTRAGPPGAQSTGAGSDGGAGR